MKKDFSPRFRLRSRADFSGLRRGRDLISGSLRLIYHINSMNHARLGLAVSRKYGGAVRRNRLKRQLRESFRLNRIRDMGVDVLVIPLRDWKQTEDAGRDMQQGLEQIMKYVHRGR